MKRRALLSSLGFADVAGCVGGENGTQQTPPNRTSTPTGTASTTPTRTPVPTNRCEEQPITPDLVVENKTDEPRAVTVTVRTDNGSRTLFERTYELAVRETLREERKLFETVRSEEETYTAHVESRDVTESADVTVVARQPTLYGVSVTVFDDGLTVHDYHGDPGPAYNPNCY